MKKHHASSGGIKETLKTLAYALLIALFVRTLAYEPFNIPSGSMIPTLLVGDYLFVSKYSYGYSRFSLPFAPEVFSGRILASDPERGDVAVFRPASQPDRDFVKRIIGLPGDKIQMRRGVLFINGEPVKRRQIEDYSYRDENGGVRIAKQYIETLPNGREYRAIYRPGSENGPFYNGDFDPNNTIIYDVPEGHYFMMGDNRDRSHDSRFIKQAGYPPASYRLSVEEKEVGYIPFENLVGRADVLWFSTDGTASFWEFWRWPSATRTERLFTTID